MVWVVCVRVIFFMNISAIFEILKNDEIIGGPLLFCELFGWEPGWRFTARCHRAGVFPMESITKTVAKQARVGPRTAVVLIMRKLFRKCLPRESFWELRNWFWAMSCSFAWSYQNIGITTRSSSFIWPDLFLKVANLVNISETSNILKNWKIMGEAVLLYELSEQEPGWRFTGRSHNTHAVV